MKNKTVSLEEILAKEIKNKVFGLSRKKYPDAKVELEDGFKSFEEYILQGKKEMGCLK